MAHIAKIENNIVTQVIVVMEQYPKKVEEIVNGKKVVKTIMISPEEWAAENIGGEWLRTSYNTKGGKHYGADGQEDDGEPIRKNFAGLGFAYDPVKDAFIPIKPDGDYVLNEETCRWEPA